MVFFLFSSLFSNPCMSILSQMLVTDKCTHYSDSECDKDVQEDCEPIMERQTGTVHCLINWTLDSEQVTDTSRQHLCSHSTPLASAKLQHTGSFFFFFLFQLFFTALMFAWNDIKPTIKIPVNYNFDHFWNVLLKRHPHSSPLTGAGALKLKF